MHADELRPEQAELAQAFERPHAVGGQALVDLVVRLVDVDVYRQIELGAVGGHLLQGRIAGRVGRVRRQAEGDQRIVADAVAQAEALLQVAVRVGSVGGGEIDHDEAGGDALMRRQGRLDRRAGEEIHVVEAGDAALQHLDAGQPGAVLDELGRRPFRLGRPDVFLQPGHQRQIVGEAAQQAHRGVGVQVDQARDEGVAGQAIAFPRLVMMIGVGAGQDIDDTALIEDEAVLFQDGRRRLDRNDPVGVDAGVANRHSFHGPDAIRATPGRQAGRGSRDSLNVLKSGLF